MLVQLRAWSRIVIIVTAMFSGRAAAGHMYGLRTTLESSSRPAESAESAGGAVEDEGEADDLLVAVRLMRACYELYAQVGGIVATGGGCCKGL